MERDNKLNKNLKLIVKSSLIVFIGVGLSKIFTYLYRVIIARYFGPEIYGIFSLAMMVSGAFIALASFGLPDGILRYIAIFRGKKQTEKIKYSIKFSLYLLLISSIIFGFMLFFLSEEIAVEIFHNEKLIFFLRVFSLAVPFSVLSNILLSTLRAYEKISIYSFISNVARNFFKVIFIVLFIFIGLGSSSVAFSHVVGALGILLFAYVICKNKIPEMWGKVKLKNKQRKEISRGIFSYSWPVVFVGVMQIILVWLDSFFIGYFKTAVEVGFYAAAVPIAALLHFVPELFMQLFFPLINKIYAKKDIILVKEISKQVVKWIFLINLPIFILIFIFPETAIEILFGKEYIVASFALRILAIGFFITTIVPTTCYNLLLMKGKSKVILFNTLIAIILNAILNYIFIPMSKIGFIDNELGINGAAIATLLSIILTSALILIETRYYVSIVPVKRKMIGIAIISLISAAILLYIRQFIAETIVNVIILGTFFVLCYIVLLLINGYLDKNDKLIIGTIKDKIRMNDRYRNSS